MEILLALTGPVFYIIGLVAFIRWLSQLGHKSDASVSELKLEAATQLREALAQDLRLRASAHTGTVKRELLAAADQMFSPEGDVLMAPSSSDPWAPVCASASIPLGAARHSGKPATGWASTDLTASLKGMDNINLLLYLGAFLVVVSAGIFVGYNFETLSGGFKTGFLALFATIFYGTGLTLFLRAPKLRPAGTTFTAIGLVMFPLVGLAAYNFTGAHAFGSAVWFITSLVTLGCYIATLAVTRQTFVAYLMAFTTLSLFESGISLIELPIYWLGWGMGVVAVGLSLLASWRGWWKEAAESLTISANLFVPASILISAVYVPGEGLLQLGVTLGLAGLFYGLLAARFAARPAGEGYWAATLVALPAALGVGLWDYVSPAQTAVLLVVLATAYLGLGWFTRTVLSRKWSELLGLIAGLVPLAAAVLVFNDPRVLLVCLLASVTISAAFALWHRQSALAMLAIFAVIIVPVIALREVPAHPASWGAVAAAYLVLAALLVLWRQKLRGWPESGDAIGMAGYLLALLAALVTAVVQGPRTVVAVCLVMACGLYALSYLEKRAGFVYAAVAAAYVALFQVARITGWSTETSAILFLLAGAGFYGLGVSITMAGSMFKGDSEHDEDRAQALRYSGLVGPFLGAVLGLSWGSKNLAPVAALATGGSLLWLEGRRQSQATIQEFAGGVVLLSFNWLLSRLDVAQTQAHTLPWAAYLAYLAYRRRQTGDQASDIFAAIALAVLTFPISGQAMGENGQLYGLELIVIALVLVGAGMSMRYRLVSWWGAGTLVVEVLYQMRDFLYALPKYLISAGLGVALLAVAIVMLQRRHNDE